MLKTLVRVLCWIVIVLLVLAAGLLAWVYVEGRPQPGTPQYVALGSSFASGPGITERVPGSPLFCGRSKDNYAQQLARLRGLALVDVTCGGATSRHVLEGGQFLQPAQLDALAPETELVTLTIGGNDIHYMRNLLAYGCDDKTTRFLRLVGACTPKTDAEVEVMLQDLQGRMSEIGAQVRQRSPQARLVYVLYQTVMPQQGTCDGLGLDQADILRMRGIEARLAEVTRKAAQQHGAEVLDAAELTRDHDVCAPQPWMTDRHARVPLHTTLEGMTAIAQGLNRLLDAPR